MAEIGPEGPDLKVSDLVAVRSDIRQARAYSRLGEYAGARSYSHNSLAAFEGCSSLFPDGAHAITVHLLRMRGTSQPCPEGDQQFGGHFTYSPLRIGASRAVEPRCLIKQHCLHLQNCE